VLAVIQDEQQSLIAQVIDDQREGIAARALELTILCATRTSETLLARWSEIDLAQRIWTLPPSRTKNGKPHRIPHIGWNDLVAPPHRPGWEGGLLAGLPARPSVYFVHSFAPVPADEKHRLADCLYDGRQISAAIRSGNAYGCQFHPEKSGPVGLRIVENFLRL